MSSNTTGNMRSISQSNASVPEQNKGTVETLGINNKWNCVSF
jgi:hypothetical protein